MLLSITTREDFLSQRYICYSLGGSTPRRLFKSAKFDLKLRKHDAWQIAEKTDFHFQAIAVAPLS
jgi:hypothetical protein